MRRRVRVELLVYIQTCILVAFVEVEHIAKLRDNEAKAMRGVDLN